MKLSLACPVCPTRFEIEIPKDCDTLWGAVSLYDIGCAEVTMPWNEVLSSHMRSHVELGQMSAALERHADAIADRATAQRLTAEAHR